VNRTDKKGGGLLIVYRKELDIQPITNNYQQEHCEYAVWRVTLNNETLLIHAFYRPPNGNIPGFVDDFTAIVTNAMEQPGVRNIYMGDFNLPQSSNMNNDLDISIFNDTLNILGLKQHINFATHILRNT